MPSIGSPGSAVARLSLLVTRCLPAVCLALLAVATPARASISSAGDRTLVPDHAITWDWPVEGHNGAPEVLRGFDPPDQPWLPGHRGIDLAADAFTLVLAAGPGTVAFAGSLAGRGVVSVEHDNGLRTTYEPVDPTVTVGEPVSTGSVLGILQPLSTHCARACLHWGLRRGEVYLDPLSLLPHQPPILLPYGPPVLRSWLANLLDPSALTGSPGAAFG